MPKYFMELKERDLFRLGHIEECIAKILELVERLQEFKEFELKWVEQDAMIRNFEIIGEAANHVSSDTKNKHPEIEWHKLRGMRNFMTHEYFGIKLEVIWDTAVEDTPVLRKHIQQIIQDMAEE